MGQLLLNIFISGSLTFLVSLSFSYIYYPARFFHIAQAAVITLGAYFAYLFSQIFHLSLFIAIPLAIITATFCGVLCEVVVYRPMRESNSSLLSYLIASIGLYVVMQNCISLAFGDDSKPLNLGEVSVGHSVFGAYVTTVQLITIIGSIMLFIGTLMFTNNTLVGKSIKAISVNPELSNIYGINTNKVVAWSFVIGSALGASAGILSGLQTNITPTMGFSILLYGIVAMVIGGVGSMRGLLGGAVVVATSQHVVAHYFDPRWMDAVAYIILIFFLMWRPLGFSGKRLRKVEI